MYYTLVNIGYLISLVNLVLYLKSFHGYGKAFQFFRWYLGIIFSIQIISFIMMKLYINNLFVSHFYFIGQFVLLGLFYESLMIAKRQKDFVKWGIGMGLLALGVQYAFDPKQFFQFNLFEIAVTSLLLVVFAVLHLYNMLTEKKEFYYINLGIIIYLLGSTVLFFVGNLTALLNPKLSLLTWTLNAGLIIIYQLFILLEWKKSFSKKAIQK